MIGKGIGLTDMQRMPITVRTLLLTRSLPRSVTSIKMIASMKHLQVLIRQRAERFLQTEHHQFPRVSGISLEDFSKLSRSRERGTIPSGCKFDYNGAYLGFFVKMPGPRHEVPVCSLVQILTREMDMLGIRWLDCLPRTKRGAKKLIRPSCRLVESRLQTSLPLSSRSVSVKRFARHNHE